jgi:ABC-type arginine transport system permease subunit
MKRLRPIAIKVVLVLAVLYAAASAGLYWVMRQPPEVFGGVMRHVPTVTLMVLPFRPLWLHARAGHLKVGDVAPDFDLASYDKKDAVQLSSFRGEEPVVLVFGSYT